jgi:hypothetical protein
LLPDNVAVANNPGEPIDGSGKMLVKLHIYIRTNFDASATFETGKIDLVTPDGKTHSLGPIQVEAIAQAKAQARESGNPIAGIISRSMIGGFHKRPVGRFEIRVTLGDQTFLAGILNFKD